MAEFQLPVPFHQSNKKPTAIHDLPHLPYWAQSDIKYAQNLLECSNDPIEYDHEDEDYHDNCFFFPEDCSGSPPSDWVFTDENSEDDLTTSSDSDQHDGDDGDIMIPGLPDIKMLDAEALSDLLEDNLSPPEITSILVFATNGAIFAYGSSLSSRQLRNLSATYGAAYTCYAKNASSGNLTGVNPASHPSSYVTAQSVSLGDVGSIVFELDDSVAVVTRIADKVLLAAVGPSNLDAVDEATTQASPNDAGRLDVEATSAAESLPNGGKRPPTNGTYSQVLANATSPSGASRSDTGTHTQADAELETQYEIDRSSDLARLASLNLSASPSTLLALESKAAALGRFLSEKLEDLESPEDF